MTTAQTRSSKKTKTKTDDPAKANGTGTSPHAQVTALIAAITAAFKERDQIVKGVFCAMLAQEHAYLVGPPGTGKSALTRVISKCLGTSYFEWLMTKFTTPEEILGPVSMSGLKADRMTRVTQGKLPDAQVVFLDEIFKSNSACLNAILSAINERVFHDDGQAKPIPLRTCIGASNELPEHADLEALNDRFLMRFLVDDLVDGDAWKDVVGSTTEPSINASMNLADFDQAIAEVEQVDIPDDTLGALWELRDNLQREGIRASTRRWKKLAKILRAYAWLQGDTEVDTLHFEVLQHGLWRDPAQRQKIASMVGKVASPVLAEATEVYDAMQELMGALPATGNVDQQGRSTIAELKKGIKKIEDIREKASGTVDGRIGKLLNELHDDHVKLRERIMVEMDL